ncbi:MAG: hypothetical protein AMJ64_02970 [Betaproteobacteria bacterium SG8_39]|nr:MAG: hypothetical protein AMJ64_02970 [Betaproteobacteria bacterium SG8_39]
MIRWARAEREALLRRIAWAGVLSAVVHTLVLAVIELPDPEPMPRADWPQVDVRFARLSPRTVSEKPVPDEPSSAARVPEVFDAAAAAPRSAAAAKTVTEPRAKPAPRAQHRAKSAPRRAPQPARIMAQHVPVPPSPDGDADGAAGAAPDVEPSAAANASSAFPRALELEYSVQEAEGQTVLGWMVYRFAREGDRYSIRAAIDAIGVASFFVKGRYVQRSEGRLTAGGLQPEQFMVRRGRRERVERASFDWQARRATLTDEKGSREVALQAGAQDQLSLAHQIAFLLETGEAARVPVTNGRRFETARIEVVGRETVQTELGQMETVRVRSDLWQGARIQLWLAPEIGYLAARLRLRDERGREAQLVLASVKAKW